MYSESPCTTWQTNFERYGFTESTPEIIKQVPPVLQGIIFPENGLGTGKRYFFVM